MTTALARVQAELIRFLDDDQYSGLESACALAKTQTVDIGELLGWVQRYRCAPESRARALRALRASLRLPVIPGPVCRRG